MPTKFENVTSSGWRSPWGRRPNRRLTVSPSAPAPSGPSTKAPNAVWDRLAAVVLIGAVVLEATRWAVLPRSLDLYYHGAVAHAFDRAGGFVAAVFWDTAPEGRPHVYPPLIHFLISALTRLAGPIGALKIVDAAMHPLLAASLWAAVRWTGTSRTAFFAALAAAFSPSFADAAVRYPAASLGLAAGLGAFASLSSGRTLSAALFLALSFYAHALVSWVSVAALLVHALVRRRLSRTLWPIGAALLLATPLLSHEARNAGAYRVVKTAGDVRLDLDLGVLVLAVAGAALAARRKRPTAAAAGAFLVGLLPVAYLYPSRYWAHGLVALVWLAAVACDGAFEAAARDRSKAAAIVAGLAVFFSLASPVLRADALSERWRVEPAAVLRQENARGLHDEARYEEIAREVKRLTAPDELFWCDFRYGGAWIGALSDRASSSTPLEETAPEKREPAALLAARASVWFKEDDGRAPEWLGPVAERYRLERAAETPWAVLYVNPAPAGRARPVPKPDVPYAAVAAAATAFAAALVFAWRRT